MTGISKFSRTAGVSIVEMAMILVIATLIISTVLLGQELIKEAQLRKVVTEYLFYKQAVFSFKQQYNALPGDMPNATDFWYNATTCPGTSYTIGGCNGDNNGYIVFSGGTSDESVRAWQHFTLAGLVPGSYSGVRAVANVNQNGIDVPASSFPNSSWSFLQVPICSGPVFANYLYFADNSTIVSGAYGPATNTLTIAQSMDIDLKIDDGMPLTGNIKGAWTDTCSYANGYFLGPDLVYGGFGGATTGGGCAIGASNEYNMTISNNYCYVSFRVN